MDANDSGFAGLVADCAGARPDPENDDIPPVPFPKSVLGLLLLTWAGAVEYFKKSPVF